MPRRNRRRPQGDPASFHHLTVALRDEWARKHGRKTSADREREARQRVEREARVAANPDRPVSLSDARAALAAYLNR